MTTHFVSYNNTIVTTHFVSYNNTVLTTHFVSYNNTVVQNIMCYIKRSNSGDLYFSIILKFFAPIVEPTAMCKTVVIKIINKAHSSLIISIQH
jgi:hypothetical protein